MAKNISKYLHTQMDKEAGIAHSQKRTKIVATVGPACDTYDNLLSLVKAGVNVFRLNFSHGTHEDKLGVIEKIRKIVKEEPYNISILGDLQGPKLRVGELENGKLILKEGDEFIFTTEKMVGTNEKIYVSYPNLTTDIKKDERIFLDDGKMELKVLKILNDKEIKMRVTLGGILTPKKGVNLPDSVLTMPSMTDKDFADLEFIIDQKLDWVALSLSPADTPTGGPLSAPTGVAATQLQSGEVLVTWLFDRLQPVDGFTVQESGAGQPLATVSRRRPAGVRHGATRLPPVHGDRVTQRLRTGRLERTASAGIDAAEPARRPAQAHRQGRREREAPTTRPSASSSG